MLGSFLRVVTDDHASISHGYGDMEPQIFWGQDLDLFESRDVVWQFWSHKDQTLQHTRSHLANALRIT